MGYFHSAYFPGVVVRVYSSFLFLWLSIIPQHTCITYLFTIEGYLITVDSSFWLLQIRLWTLMYSSLCVNISFQGRGSEKWHKRGCFNEIAWSSYAWSHYTLFNLITRGVYTTCLTLLDSNNTLGISSGSFYMNWKNSYQISDLGRIYPVR